MDRRIDANMVRRAGTVKGLGTAGNVAKGTQTAAAAALGSPYSLR